MLLLGPVLLVSFIGFKRIMLRNIFSEGFKGHPGVVVSGSLNPKP